MTTQPDNNELKVYQSKLEVDKQMYQDRCFEFGAKNTVLREEVDQLRKDLDGALQLLSEIGQPNYNQNCDYCNGYVAIFKGQKSEHEKNCLITRVNDVLAKHNKESEA